MLDEDGFENGLWDIDVTARTSSIIIPLIITLIQHDELRKGVGFRIGFEFAYIRTHHSCWIVPPGIHPRVLLSSHTPAPSRVLHAATVYRELHAIILQPNVTETLEGGHVGDMCPGGICRTRGSRQHYAFQAWWGV